MRLKGAAVLITGASSGIGEATALAFARQRARLAICARRPERLHAVAEECRRQGAAAVLTVTADISRRADAQRFVDSALEEFRRVDVLVNNAGSGWRGRFEQMPEEDVRRIFETNVLGTMWTTQSALPTMLARRQGVIINVASVVGFRATPYSSAYSGSKYAVVGFSHGLRGELSGTGVKVCVVYPPGTRTEFAGGQATPKNLRYPPSWIAAAIVRTARFPRRDVITVPFRLGLWLEPFFGGLLDHVLGELRRGSMAALAHEEPTPREPKVRRARRSRARL